MLDLKLVREHQAEIEENVRRRKAKADVARIVQLDEQRLALLQRVEGQRSQLRQSSKEKPDQEEIVRLRQLGEQIRQEEAELRKVEQQLKEEAALLPNVSSPEMPVGEGEADNVEVVVWLPEHGYVPGDQLGKAEELRYRSLLPPGDFRRHHQEVGESLGVIDMAQGAKVAGTRFAYLLDGAALLENAIVQLLSRKLLDEGFVWVDPPLLVQERVLFGTSHFPEGRDQVYQVSTEHVEEGRELFLVGSAEPPLFAYGMDRVFDADQLPLKMFAVTPCFRSEVGSWGKDVRGIKRVHQFNKLEMDVICRPEESVAIFEQLRECNEWLLQRLGLPYRVINKCTGDCGYLATAKQYDVEAWMPSQQEFMEVMTDTNATDFQARRLNIRYKTGDGRRELVHTVNDTGAALGRLVAAILDNYQQVDGSVVVPEVLREWVGADRLVPNRFASLTSK